MLIIPIVNEVVGLHWFHHGCSSVCVHLSVCGNSGFCRMTPLPFAVQWWYFTHVFDHHPRRNYNDFGVKRSDIFWLRTFYRFRTITPFSFFHKMIILHTCIDHVREVPLSILGFKGQSQGHVWTLNFLPFPHDDSISFWHTLIILHTFIEHDPRKTSIDFGIKRSKVKAIFGLWFF